MKQVFRRLGIFIENQHVLVVVVCFLLVIPAIWGARQIEMSSGTETFVSTDSEFYRDFTRFSDSFSGEVIVVMIKGDNLPALVGDGNLAAMEDVQRQLDADPGVKSVITPALFIRQAMAAQGGEAALPEDEGMLMGVITDPETGAIRPQFAQVFPDDQHSLMFVVLDGGLDMDLQEALVQDTRNAIDAAGFSGVETVVTGQPAMYSEMNQLMNQSLRSMMIASVVLMLLILALLFKVRNFFAWRWLPLGIVIIGIIYAFGIMGVLSVPMTMVTMAAFPVLIGLGVDYTIQFHNRYDEEARRGEKVADAIIDSITHIGPAIGMAIIVACLGFAALFFSPVPMINDFGYTLIIGVVSCYLLAMFLLLAILYWHDRHRQEKQDGRKTAEVAADSSGDTGGSVEPAGFVERALRRMAPGIIKSAAIIIPVALVLSGVGLYLDSRIGTQSDQSQFMSQDLQMFKDLGELEAVAGGQSSANLFVEADDVTDPEVLDWMADLQGRIVNEQAQVVTGTSSVVDMLRQAGGGAIPRDPAAIRQILDSMPPTVKSNLLNEDLTAANIIISVGNLDSEQIEELLSAMEGYLGEGVPPGVDVTITGGIVMQDTVVSALTEGREKMTLIGIGMVFAGILLLFRLRLKRALVAVLPIGLIIGWSAIVMYLLGIDYTPITATLGALIIGIGVEFTILLMTRYYEEREKGEGPEVAMTTAMTKIGRAIIASGLTVIAGFGALLIARDFPILQDFGIVTMINVLFALVSTLLVLPPLIVWVDSRRGGS
ncbi:putative membrane protein YdgH [bacterium BMS3Abin01]|nr:putative membrane protein YdgH [bacterium BMS3Abin01]HDZ59513.1 RND family transporter [Actinomycetota bacterium]